MTETSTTFRVEDYRSYLVVLPRAHTFHVSRDEDVVTAIAEEVKRVVVARELSGADIATSCSA